MTAHETGTGGPDSHRAGASLLDWDGTLTALGDLAGTRIAVRVVLRGAPEVLVAALRGHLGTGPRAQGPALFWPTHAESEDQHADLEATGIYLRRDRFEPSAASPARDVLHIVQGPVIVNVRRV